MPTPFTVGGETYKSRWDPKLFELPLAEQIPAAAAGYGAAWEAAETANKARFAQGQSDYASLYARTKYLVGGLGQQARQDINLRAQQEKGGVQQSLIDRGLFNSTLLGGAVGGVEKRRGDALNRLSEMLMQQELTFLNPISQSLIDFEERRTDEYPNEALFVGQMERAGAALETRRQEALDKEKADEARYQDIFDSSRPEYDRDLNAYASNLATRTTGSSYTSVVNQILAGIKAGKRSVQVSVVSTSGVSRGSWTVSLDFPAYKDYVQERV